MKTGTAERLRDENGIGSTAADDGGHQAAFDVPRSLDRRRASDVRVVRGTSFRVAH
jgi:hypothetical protein